MLAVVVMAVAVPYAAIAGDETAVEIFERDHSAHGHGEGESTFITVSDIFDAELIERIRAAERTILAYESGEITEGVIIAGSVEELQTREAECKLGAFLYQRITYMYCIPFPHPLSPTWRDMYKVENVYSCQTCPNVIVLSAGTETRACYHK